MTLLQFQKIIWLSFTMTYKKLNANKERTTISSLDRHFKFVSLVSLSQHLVNLVITVRQQQHCGLILSV